jgi:XTP/dITP diphosphohydrolase
MDRLRSPGGCPWDAQQTHASLVPYLIEEAHEAVEALESGDDDHMVEELGDVLLQVVFHARVAAERDDGFDIDDVSARLVEKLVYRHPHVFAGADAADASAVEASWERLKSVEKPQREHPLEGIPAGMPELARAAKVAARLERAGRGDRLRAEITSRLTAGAAGSNALVAARLMDVVLAARSEGVDPSAALRGLLRELASLELDSPAP